MFKISKMTLVRVNVKDNCFSGNIIQFYGEHPQMTSHKFDPKLKPVPIDVCTKSHICHMVG